MTFLGPAERVLRDGALWSGARDDKSGPDTISAGQTDHQGY